MAIPSRGIGWSEQSNLLWQISKQLDRTLSVLCTGPCSTTTTTTTAALVNDTNSFVDCPAPCNEGCVEPFNYFDVWMTEECIELFPTVGCAIWLNIEGTLAFPDGSYNDGNFACITITDGIITNII